MSRRRQQKRSARRQTDKPQQLQTPAMLDVVFLLLIFFIATAVPLLPEARHPVELPSPVQATAPTPRLEPESRPMIVTVSRHGYRVFNRQVTRDRLREDLHAVALLDEKTTVLVRVEPDAFNEAVITLFDLCAEARLKDLKVVNGG